MVNRENKKNAAFDTSMTGAMASLPIETLTLQRHLLKATSTDGGEVKKIEDWLSEKQFAKALREALASMARARRDESKD